MLCLEPSVVDAVWSTISHLIPAPPSPDSHPLGCHRPRVDDRECFTWLLTKLVTGVSWEVLGQLGPVSSGTLKRRRTDWVTAGVFDDLFGQSVAGYEKLIGFDLGSVLVDGSTQKAPAGGDGTGKNPTDKGKAGYKWSLATDADGLPLAVVTDGANVPDYQLLDPTLAIVAGHGLLGAGTKVRCDRGYDYPLVHTLLEENELVNRVRRKRKPGQPKDATGGLLGQRWPVERTNAWLVGFGQLRRSTDRCLIKREAWIYLAMALILVSRIVRSAHLRPAY